ncbi:MAG TPA: hypothetical protein VFK02_24610 [Kofleriaceae bacterium]|nr:hypothetical protein [Kofleriaceae bacterium]
MSTPATRGDLHEAIVPLATKVELQEAIAPLATKAEIAPLATKVELQEAVARLATKAELQSCFAALLARIESGEQRMVERFDGLEQRLRADLAQHVNVIFERTSAMIAVIDDKYADLPGRVSRLETTVFPRGQR